MIKSNHFIIPLQQALERFGHLVEAGCRWKVCSGNSILPEPDLPFEQTKHAECFCIAVKKNAKTEMLCLHNDSKLLYERIKSHKSGFVHCCHAGAAEVVVPIWLAAQECIGVVMVGPFRMPDINVMPSCADAFRALPELTQAKADAIIRFVPDIFRDVICRIYEGSSGILTESPHDKRIIRVLEYLRQNLFKEPTPKAAAKEVFMSTSRLYHLFKKECGISIWEYVLKLRLREARRLLLSGENLSVSQICMDTDFTDQSHFTALFRREFGLPPLQYRKKFSEN